MKRFLLMLQFFTRIPVNISLPAEARDFRRGSVYFPLIGLVVGLFSSLAYYLAVYTGNRFFASVAAVMAWIMVTGALHLDGLSDTCDGIFSSRSKDRVLEIMKDSRIGTMGALALLLAVLLKVSLIRGLDLKSGIYALIISPVIARTSVLFGIVIAKYPREKGLGKMFIGNVTIREFIVGFIICVLIVSPFLKLYSFAFFAGVFIIPWIFNRYMESKIGGMTGDTLGALCEIQEIISLLMFSVLSGYIWR